MTRIPVTVPDRSDATRVGDQLGTRVAWLVIRNFQAMQAGLDHGYEWESYAATHTPIPERLAYIPEPYDQVPRLTDTYQRMFTQGRAEYRADHPTSTGPATGDASAVAAP